VATAPYPPWIAVVSEGMQMASGRPAEQRDQLPLAERGDLGDGLDPGSV
jgi:hypothetical protein